MRLLAILCAGVVTTAAHAQDLPPYVPLNPALAARSALYAQPFVDRHGGWRTRAVIDYSNAVEVATSADQRQYAFDAEMLQVDAWLSRDVSAKFFVLGNIAFRSAHAGRLDGFLNWYHDLIGLRVPARNQRAPDQFAWDFDLGGESYHRDPAAFVGDLRVGAGMRLTSEVQLVATMTLPTATTRSEGWGRGTIGTALSLSGRLLRTGRVAVEAGASAGWTPAHGTLAQYQRAVFVGTMVAARWRFLGRQSVFSTIWVQSPNWKGTGFSALDRAEVTMDFGALLQVGRGLPELQVGMTEDLLPGGPAVDAGFKLGVRW